MTPSGTTRESRGRSVCALVIVALVLLWGMLRLWTDAALAGKRQVAQLMTNVELGQSREEVLEHFQAGEYPNLVLHTGPDFLSFRIVPFHPSAEWMVFIVFEDDHVSGMFVRDTDIGGKPKDSPPDRPWNVRVGDSSATGECTGGGY